MPPLIEAHDTPSCRDETRRDLVERMVIVQVPVRQERGRTLAGRQASKASPVLARERLLATRQWASRHWRGDVRLDVRGLAALYSGFTTPHALVAQGLASGTDEAMVALRSMFAGPEPWCCDHY